MLPDVIDEFMIKTGTRRESIFYSFYVFFTKISSAIAIAITSAILE
jgi:Na+/melibiose symporter-like transporter